MGLSAKHKGKSNGLHKVFLNGSMADPGAAAGKTAGGGGQTAVPRGNHPVGKLQGAVCKKGGC